MESNCVKTPNREFGIDVLRVAAMLGIVLFHHFGTKVPNHFVQLPDGFTTDTYFYDLINNAPDHVSKASLLMDFFYGHLGMGGNLVFMLVTGYFLFGRNSSFKKRVNTVGKVLLALAFYGVILTILNCVVLILIRPHVAIMPIKPLFTLPNWLSGENMWYLQAYGIFILAILPILKLFEDWLTRDTHKLLCIALISVNLLAYSKYLPNLWISDKILYFVMCYYIGGYVRTYGVNLSCKRLICILGLYVITYFCYEYYWRYANKALYSPNEYSYIKVMQPFICCLSFAFLCFAIATKIKAPAGQGILKALGSISSTTIGIYIFHFNTVSIAFVLANEFWWHDWTRNGFFLFNLLDTLILFFISYLIEVLRQKLMKVLRLRLVQ